MPITNKKPKEEIKEEIDEVLNETPPGTEAPPTFKIEDLLAKDPSELEASEMDFLDEHKDDLTDEQKVAVGLMDGEAVPTPSPEIPSVQPEPPAPPAPEAPPAPVVEEVIPPVEVKKVDEPTEAELRAYVLQDGVDLDELTNFEKATAKRNYMIEKRQEAINAGFDAQKQVSERSKQIDTFIESTDGKPEFAKLGGHEAEFKRFAMNQGGDIEKVLLPAFLYNLPVVPPKRGSLLEHGGGGERPAQPKTDIDDADLVKNLREKDPKEYKRQLKAGKIKIEID